MVEKIPDIRNVDNLEIHKDKVIVSVNPRFYNIDVVYSSIYMFLDRCYCKVNGDPTDEIIVELKPKNKSDLEILGRELNNELVNYVVIGIRGRRTIDMRTEIVQRALRSHEPEIEKDTPKEKTFEEEKNEIKK